MNGRLSIILLLTLLNWGLIAAEAKNIQRFSLQIWRYSVANEALSTMPLASKEYNPPNCGLPMRREGGGARWRQNRLPTQVAPQQGLMENNIQFS